ncbi:hypothetical protein, partial [Plasmodium yoelii yoelii]
MTIHIFLITR